MTTTTTNTKRLVVVVGPTGSGKTDLAIALAQHYGAPIVSTDSRQFYRGMPIGTAQPTAQQLRAAEHHFIASHDITQELSCGAYEVEALALLDRLFEQHRTVIAVGGSGLYIKALCEGMDELPQVDRSNPARVVRALEVCLQTGRPFSELRLGRRRERPFDIVKIGIEVPREELYERINRRVDAMMAEGLEAEARALYPYRHLNALRTVGYRELFDFFEGRCSRDEAVEAIKRNTRRYAKRQMTWFRRDGEIRWFRRDDLEAMFRHVDFGES